MADSDKWAATFSLDRGPEALLSERDIVAGLKRAREVIFFILNDNAPVRNNKATDISLGRMRAELKRPNTFVRLMSTGRP